jgi:ligand-binding sensor domain-containing protein/signal transduction histidine kinase
MKRISVILVLWVLFITQGFSQQYNFTNYSINEGLSQSVVNCVFQDSKGFMWFGTQNGLNRFNGETFDIYIHNPLDTNSISNNWIYSITEDKEGNLWIGTKGGLNMYRPALDNFLRIKYNTGFDYDLTKYFYDVICLDNGNIVINTPPVITVYQPDKESFTHFSSNFDYEGSVIDVRIPLLEELDSSIWVGSTKGLALFSFVNNQFRYFSFVNRNGIKSEIVNVSALFKDHNGRVWAGTTEGLYSYNPGSNYFEESWFEVKGKKVYLENTCVRSIIEDKYGNLHIGTEGQGLFVISFSQNGQASINNYTAENSQIGHDMVQSLVIDKSENLWVGNLQGISKTDLKKKNFNLYRNSNSPNSVDLLDNVIASLYKDDEGILWVGNWGQGLNLFNRETNEVEHFSTGLKGNHRISNDFVHVIFNDSENNIWVGTRNGILIYDKPGNQFVPYYTHFQNPELPKLENTRVYKIIQDRNSNFWVGTQNGLVKINLKNSVVETFKAELENKNHISANLVYDLLEDQDGLIWIATVNGLDVYYPQSKEIKHFKKEDGLIDEFIITLSEDQHGKIWIGTSTYVNVFNKKDSSFTWYSETEGLPNNRIFEIVKDKNNVMWVTTGKGLCRFDEELNTFQTFTPEDGLQSLEFNIRAAFVCDDGELLFEGMNGFNAFYPDSIGKNPFIPKLAFTSVYSTKGRIKEFINTAESERVILNYNITSFTIEFAALEFTNPAKNMFKYQMEGISNEWIEIGNRRFVPFSGLPPGDYVFKVKGSNNDGVWNENEISINFVILPPWWRSIYAYLGYVILIVVAIVVFIRQRERMLIRDKKNLEQKVLERTLQIEKQNQLIVSKNQELEELNHTKDKLFSIIGHDLGNQFNIILGFLDVLVSDFKKLDQAKIEGHLNNINNSSKQAYNLLENLLTWARMQTNLIQYIPEDFEVHKKIKNSVVFFEGACARKNIKIEVEENEKIMVSADLNMFSTVFRNLVSNAIKFTNENGMILISAKKHNGFCQIVVQDDGIGISKEELGKIFKVGSKHKTLGTKGEKGTGLGLVLCKEFVEKQGGKLEVESQPGKGSKFSFTLPLQKE